MDKVEGAYRLVTRLMDFEREHEDRKRLADFIARRNREGWK